MYQSYNSSNQEDTFVDDNGNEWKWDGEDYVLRDAEGTPWIFDGEDWLAKGEDGLRWVLADGQWYVKGLNGKRYVRDAEGNLVEYIPPAPESKAAQEVQAAVTENTDTNNNRSGHKERHRHKRRHRHRSTAAVEQPQERIHVVAKLPPQMGVGPPPRIVRVNDAQRAEIIRIPGTAALPPFPCHPPRMMVGHTAGPHCCASRSRSSAPSSSMSRPCACSDSVSSPVGPSVPSPVQVTSPRESGPGVCSKLKNALTSIFTSKQEASTVDIAQLSASALSESKSTGVACAKSLSNMSSLPEGGKLVPLAQALRMERLRRNGSQQGTSTAIENLEVPAYDPVKAAIENLPADKSAAKFKEMAVSLLDFEKESDTSDARQITLNRLLAFTKSIAMKLQADQDKGQHTAADDLVVVLCNTMEALVRDNLRRMKSYSAIDKFWSPKEAYRSDALCSRTGQLLNEATMKLDEAETQLKSTVREVLDILNNPSQNITGRTPEQRTALAKLIEDQVTEVFEIKRTFERLEMEANQTREGVEKLSFANPKCPCRPQLALVEDDCKFLIQRLRETSEALKTAREKLLVSEIREMHQKNRANYFHAQLKVLISRGGGEPEDTLRLVNEGSMRMEEKERQLEKRLKNLESQLDAYKKNSAPSQIPADMTLASKLFTLNPEDMNLMRPRGHGAQDPLAVTKLAPLQQPPLRTLPIVQPPVIPAVELRISGDLSGVARNLGDMLGQLLTAKGKINPNSHLDNAVDRVVDNIRQMIQRLEDGMQTEESTALARQLSKDITKLAFKELPANLPITDAKLLRGIQDMAQRCHNLATEVKTARPRGHIPFDPGFAGGNDAL